MSNNTSHRLYYIFIFSFSILYSFLEYAWLQYAESTGPKIICGQFSEYHVYMFIVFSLVACSSYLINKALAGWQHIAFMLLIEDVFYHVAGWYLPEPGQWADWPVSGFYVLGLYIPGGYIMLGIIISLSYSASLFSKKLP